MRVAFDTNILISRKVRSFPRNHYLSSVVLAEILSGAADREVIKFWTTTKAFFQRADRFLVPDADDWLQAGLTLQRLSQGACVRLFNDCLLAVSCRRTGVVVVPDNAKNFDRLAGACRVGFQGGEEFFVPVLSL